MGNDRLGPVAESVDAGAVHRSLSWFKSRPGLQPSLLRSFGLAGQRQGCPAITRRATAGTTLAAKSRLMGPFRGFAGAESGLKTTRARGKPALLAQGTRGMRALFLCPIPSPREL